MYWEIGPRIYLTEVHGYLTTEMSRLIIERAGPLYQKPGRVHGFHNWFDMTNYDSACRVELTAWVLRHREQSALHIGVASRMVAMGVTVANLALGNLMHVHADMKSLEAAVADAALQSRKADPAT